jgi:hypothetical protein
MGLLCNSPFPAAATPLTYTGYGFGFNGQSFVDVDMDSPISLSNGVYIFNFDIGGGLAGATRLAPAFAALVRGRLAAHPSRRRQGRQQCCSAAAPWMLPLATATLMCLQCSQAPSSPLPFPAVNGVWPVGCQPPAGVIRSPPPCKSPPVGRARAPPPCASPPVRMKQQRVPPPPPIKVSAQRPAPSCPPPVSVHSWFSWGRELTLSHIACMLSCEGARRRCQRSPRAPPPSPAPRPSPRHPPRPPWPSPLPLQASSTRRSARPSCPPTSSAAARPAAQTCPRSRDPCALTPSTPATAARCGGQGHAPACMYALMRSPCALWARLPIGEGLAAAGLCPLRCVLQRRVRGACPLRHRPAPCATGRMSGTTSAGTPLRSARPRQAAGRRPVRGAARGPRIPLRWSCCGALVRADAPAAPGTAPSSSSLLLPVGWPCSPCSHGT